VGIRLFSNDKTRLVNANLAIRIIGDINVDFKIVELSRLALHINVEHSDDLPLP